MFLIVFHGDPTAAYADLWIRVENGACAAAALQGQTFDRASFGRGQTPAPRVTCFQPAPLRKGGHGEIQPGYYGYSVRYSQWFKQLRRLQYLAKLAQGSALSSSAAVAKVETWRAVRFAPGFPGGFCSWWAMVVFPKHGGVAELSFCCPPAAILQEIFDTFAKEVEAFGSLLCRQRQKRAKHLRKRDMNYVFRDCSRPRPAAVDTLVASHVAEVADVDVDECAVCWTVPQSAFVGVGELTAGGKRREVIQAEDDKVWLSSLEGVRPGLPFRSTRVVANTCEILREFERVWSARWIKPDHVLPSQWMQIVAFAKRTLAPIQWNFQPWTADMVLAVAKHKKPETAVGPDGVSCKDLLSLPGGALESLALMFDQIEGSGIWPLQLCTGFVSSLEKKQGNLDVDAFRPVTVLFLGHSALVFCSFSPG